MPDSDLDFAGAEHIRPQYSLGIFGLHADADGAGLARSPRCRSRRPCREIPPAPGPGCGIRPACPTLNPPQVFFKYLQIYPDSGDIGHGEEFRHGFDRLAQRSPATHDRAIQRCKDFHFIADVLRLLAPKEPFDSLSMPKLRNRCVALSSSASARWSSALGLEYLFAGDDSLLVEPLLA